MNLKKSDVLREHIDMAKDVLKGEWCGFVSTELFVNIAYDEHVEKVCLEKMVTVQQYIRRVIHTAQREITNSKNWPYWVGVGRSR